MRILVGKHGGFCFGVERAVRMAEAEAGKGQIYTYGNIIHNEIVVDELKSRGIIPVQSLDGLKEDDTVVIRAHGVPPEVYADCESKGIRVVDATCPFVKRIHRLVEDTVRNGGFVYIVGKRDHPEIIGIRGYAKGRAEVLETPSEAERVPMRENACCVAQTTHPRDQYATVAEILKQRMPDLQVHDTICDTTVHRQREAALIAEKCTRVLVLGSASSANTKRLEEICREHCENVQKVNKIGKFFLANLQSDDIIGIVAGASTPGRIIREVIQGMSEQEKTTVETIEAEAPAVAAVAANIDEIIEKVESTVETAENVIEEAEKTVESVVEETIDSVKEPEAEEKAPEQEPEKNPEAEEPAVEADSQEKDVQTQEEASDFAKAFEQTLTRIHNGQLIKGTVLQIVDGEVYVNVGYKSDGIIPKSEFSTDPDSNPSDLYKEGDEIEVEVVKVNDGEGNVLLSRKNVESKRVWERLLGEEDLEGKTFEAVGKEVVKGGVIADINGVRAFVPASQVSLKYTDNLQEFVGKPMKLEILEVDKQRKRIVASQKKVLLAEQKAAKREKWEQLVVGSKVKGIVRRITDFGAFVDIGGLDGLVHVTDVGWGRVKHTSDILSVGQEIEVLILNVDIEKERISLGYKQLQPKPWTLAAEKYPVGTIVEGKVVRIVPFGAFVALESTIDGLIHISQVGVHRIEKVEDELKVGDIVRCKVLEVNPEAKRISLSRKEALIEENEEIAKQVEEEKAERERLRQERREQREKEKEQQAAAAEAKRQSREKAGEGRGKRRSGEDGEYELPPVETATTSLADLFSAIKTDD